jgi:hypothetical protein
VGSRRPPLHGLEHRGNLGGRDHARSSTIVHSTPLVPRESGVFRFVTLALRYGTGLTASRPMQPKTSF